LKNLYKLRIEKKRKGEGIKNGRNRIVFRNRYEIDCIAGDLKVEVKAGKPHWKYPRNVIVLDEGDIPRL